MAEPKTVTPETGASRRDELRRFLELFAVCGFVFTQPVLDVMGRSPDFFVFWHAGRWDLVLLTLVIVAVPPLVLWTIGVLVGIVFDSQRLRVAVHLGTVGVLLVLLAIQIVKHLSSTRGVLLLVAALLFAGAVTAAIARWEGVRGWLRFLWPAPLVFAGLFLFFSPSADLVLPASKPQNAAAATSSKTPIVMVFFDEFPLMSLLDRNGQIDKRLYPNIANLAAHSTWYRNATGVSPFTPTAVPAMLSGRFPRKSLAPVASEYPDTLFSLLRDSHRLIVSESITNLCTKDCHDPSGQRRAGPFGLVRDATKVWGHLVSPAHSNVDPSDATFVEQAVAGQDTHPSNAQDATFGFSRLGENQPSRFTDFLRAIKKPGPGRPPLYFLHILMPHRPWRFVPSGRRTVAQVGPTTPPRWPSKGDWRNEYSLQRHLLQVGYTDGLVRSLVQRLRAQGLYDKALLVITADHGISFKPDTAIREWDSTSPDQLAWVPLFIKAPGQTTGRTTDMNWEHVDLLPTLTDMLHIKLPWKSDGLSALRSKRRDPTRKEFYAGPDNPRPVSVAEFRPTVLRGFTAGFLRPQDGPNGLFAPGPYGALVGKAPGDGVKGSADGLSAKFDRADAFKHARVKRGIVPAIAAGVLRVDDGTSVPSWLAVAVNGKIGGLTQVYRARGANRFAAFALDSLFQQGANDVSLYAVSGSPDRPVLRTVRLR